MKRLITVGLTLVLLFGAVACSKKTDESTTNGNDKVVDDAYMNYYRGAYEANILPLNDYEMYTSDDTARNAFKDKQYPGNEAYLTDVRNAYNDSREKIQSFVDALKDDTNIGDDALKAENDKLITEGENLINTIDTRVTRLDRITTQDYSRNQDDFIDYVNEVLNDDDNDDTNDKDDKDDDKVTNNFRDLLNQMNKRLGITK